jgi:hypothetical protein
MYRFTYIKNKHLQIKEGKTVNIPPPAIVALIKLSNSSSPLMANWRWRGVIRFTFKSFDALPANSRTYKSKVTRTLITTSYNDLPIMLILTPRTFEEIPAKIKLLMN